MNGTHGKRRDLASDVMPPGLHSKLYEGSRHWCIEPIHILAMYWSKRSKPGLLVWERRYLT